MLNKKQDIKVCSRGYVMKFEEYSYLNGLEIIRNIPEVYEKYQEVLCAIKSIKDDEIIAKYYDLDSGKSLGTALKRIIEEKVVDLNWERNVPIFDDKEVNTGGGRWKSDFVLPSYFSMVVSFEHSSAMTNNLMKLELASEESHMNKNVQTKFGILITTTNELKINGGFDNVVGEFEKYQVHCRVLQNHLKTPMIIIGLKAPESFRITHEKV